MIKVLRHKIRQFGLAGMALALAVAIASLAAIALDSADADAQDEVVSALIVGGDHVCALTTAHEIICWGRNDLGQTNAPQYSDFNCEFSADGVEVCEGGGSVGVAAGGSHTCKINDEDGSIQCVGRNDSGQTDVPGREFLPVRYMSVAAGREHTCAVTDEQRLRCWGEDNLGQSSPPGGAIYRKVSSNAFANFNCAITIEHKVLCWGDNRYGQLNVPAAIAAPPPLQFTQPIRREFVSRKGQPIGPIVFPPATGGKGTLTYYFEHYRAGRDEKIKMGLPTGLVFDQTTRQLSGRYFGDHDLFQLWYTVSETYTADTDGRIERAHILLNIYGPVPAGYAPALTRLELGTLDRGLIRCSLWSEESRITSNGNALEAYIFHIAQPAQVTIDLESEEADANLVLARYGTDDFWRNDDGSQGTNARITVGLAPAKYKLTVYTSEGQDEGAYTLRIRSPDFPGGNADADRLCPDGRRASEDTPAETSEGTPAEASEGTLDSATAGRITARRLDDGRTEFAWQVEGGDRILPRSRYLPSEPPTGRWLNSSDIVVEGVNLGRINVRVDAQTGRIEFAFTPAGRDRILPRSRYFPSDAETDRWLRSTLIEPGG